jgi:hypothetical protein
LVWFDVIGQGPMPTAVTAVPMDNDTQAIIIANGLVGGLYLYEATTNPINANTAPDVTFRVLQTSNTDRSSKREPGNTPPHNMI